MKFHKILIIPLGFVLLLVALLGTTAIESIFSRSTPVIEPRNFAECASLTESVIENTNPPVCRTGSGGLFVGKENDKVVSEVTPEPTADTTISGQGFCGGFGGIQCPKGFTCKIEAKHPDAGGKCEAETNP